MLSRGAKVNETGLMGPWWMNESIEIINAKTSFTVPRSDAVVARQSDGARPGCIRRTGGEPPLGG